MLLYITKSSIKNQSFVYTQLNDQTVLFLTIHFCISLLFALSLNVKEFYLIHTYILLWTRKNARVNLGAMGMKGTPHSPKLQHYWSLNIGLFSVISRILVAQESYPFAETQFYNFSILQLSRPDCFV